MSVALTRGLSKLGRTVLQWVVALGTTGITIKLADYLGVTFSPAIDVMFQAFWMFLYTFAQNALETSGKIPVILPSPPIPVPENTTPVPGGINSVPEETNP